MHGWPAQPARDVSSRHGACAVELQTGESARKFAKVVAEVLRVRFKHRVTSLCRTAKSANHRHHEAAPSACKSASFLSRGTILSAVLLRSAAGLSCQRVATCPPESLAHTQLVHIAAECICAQQRALLLASPCHRSGRYVRLQDQPRKGRRKLMRNRLPSRSSRIWWRRMSTQVGLWQWRSSRSSLRPGPWRLRSSRSVTRKALTSRCQQPISWLR